MTALTRFERLESGGLWRETATCDPVEVTVSFGKATLVLQNYAGLPLCHWSLPAVTRMNTGERPALFSPAPETDETLEIEDDLMIDAIEAVRTALAKAGPRSTRLRRFVTVLGVGIIFLAAVIWGPDAFLRRTLLAVPDTKRVEIGAMVLGHYQSLTGPTCRNPIGMGPLDTLKTRLMGANASGQIVVVQNLKQGAALLPGGIVIIDRVLIEKLDDPAIAAGFILAAIAGRSSHDPLGDVLADTGLNATVQLFTTGELPADTLLNYADQIRETAVTAVDESDLRLAFEAASIPLAPYAAIRDPAGTIFDEITMYPVESILDDSDWVRLQGICIP